MRLFITFGLILFTFNSFAQKPYVPMSDVTSWKHFVGSFAGSNEFWLSYNGDTLINGNSYRKIVNYELPVIVNFYLREDISEKKVYEYNEYQDKEYLLYDFGLEVGDPFISEKFNNAPFEVIGKELVASPVGDLYKWRISMGPNSSYFEYTEAIGADYLFYNPLISDPVYFLNCAYNECQKIYGDMDCGHHPAYSLTEEIEVQICEGESFMGFENEGIHTFEEQANGVECATFFTVYLSFTVEVPYNGLDDDCDPATLDDDLDQDGFASANDCDDMNNMINPDQTEIPFNDIDDDCNPETLDDDQDQDGYSSADDCDDTNAMINPDQTEEPYNGVDDDCNPETLDDDLDQDGYASANDCDDSNNMINPDAEEIANNGIDEDCDGGDLVSATHELADSIVKIYPNPATHLINIDIDMVLDFSVTLFDLQGRIVQQQLNVKQIKVSSLANGIYLMEVEDLGTGQRIIERVVVTN